MSDKEEYGAEDYGSQADDGDEVEIITDNEESEQDDNNQGGAGIGQHEKKKKIKIPDADRITSRFMTKYEKARILGTRAL